MFGYSSIQRKVLNYYILLDFWELSDFVLLKLDFLINSKAKMEFSRNPACEDSVDRFNHTWLVYFFLFMAALTFFLPYGLPLSAEVKRQEDLPRYTPKCWCPAQLTESHVEFINAACRTAFLKAHSGSHEESDLENNNAILYKMTNQVDKEFWEKYRPETDMNSSLAEDFGRNKLTETAYFLFDYLPFFLFSSAILFKLSHLSFVLFMFWNGVNVSGLIKTWQTLYQEGERGQQRRRDFTHVVSERLGSSRRLACGYVIYKAIICFISVLFILIVSRYLMPRIEMAQLSSKSSSYTFESLNLICEVPVRVFTNLHMYTIQCFFKQLPVSDMRADLSNDTVAASALKMYASILGALLFTFFIITTVNAVNLTVWMVKLCRNRCISGSKQTLSLDASLLVRLMEEHSDAVASKMMEDSLIRESPKPNAELTNEATDVV